MKNYKFLLGGLLAASLSIGFVSCRDDEDATPSDVPSNNVSNNTNNSTNDSDKKEEQKPAINPKFDFSSALNATDKTVDCGKELTFTVSNCNDAAVFVFVDGKLISGNNNVFKLPTDKEGKHEVSITVNSTDYTENYEVKAVAKPDEGSGEDDPTTPGEIFVGRDTTNTPPAPANPNGKPSKGLDELWYYPFDDSDLENRKVSEGLHWKITFVGVPENSPIFVFVDGKRIKSNNNTFLMPTDKAGEYEVSITIGGEDYTLSFEVCGLGGCPESSSGGGGMGSEDNSGSGSDE